MRNIHIKEVRPRPQADDDVVWNSLPKVALDLEDILVHYEEKKKVIKIFLGLRGPHGIPSLVR